MAKLTHAPMQSLVPKQRPISTAMRHDIKQKRCKQCREKDRIALRHLCCPFVQVCPTALQANGDLIPSSDTNR